ncbi:MAG: hypothetical protein K9J81_09085 [Desulfohalobiaceae bacterium]|nr:hypothetical protein [Desulfohalobiaceae bacterium]
MVRTDKYPFPILDPEQLYTKEDVEQAVADLLQAIRYHNHRYYDLDDPVISDREYDRLLKNLQALEARFPEWTRVPLATSARTIEKFSMM